MRIVGGEYRGRAIQAPEGTATRPTTDRVREALFSSLYSLTGGFEGLQVLDAFAGSGALGIEAVSRGAARAVFCESDKKACGVIRKNLSVCGIDADRGYLLQGDAFKSVARLRQMGYAFDIVFLDPPYAYDAADIAAYIYALVAEELANKDTFFIYEHSLADRAQVEHECTQAGLIVRVTKKYGKTGISIVQCV